SAYGCAGADASALKKSMRCGIGALYRPSPPDLRGVVDMQEILIIGGGVLGLLPVIVSLFLRDVEAGTIRLVSWLQGSTAIYRGPGKSKEIPLLTTGTTISSKVLNVDLDITDQTADVDEQGFPQPIKVRVLASAIVSVGDSDVM